MVSSYSSEKKESEYMLAKQYKLTGFCVSGKPGVIVAEGMSESVNAYVAELKVESIIVLLVHIKYCAHRLGAGKG